LGRTLSHPARLIPLGFLAAILLGTVVLMLPISRAGPGGAPFITALFTATSAVCITGLAVVDTATYWSGFGRAALLVMFQVGGFGIMSGATLLGLLVARRLRLGTRLVAQAETRSLGLGDVKAVLRLVLIIAAVVQTVVATVLTLRLRFGHGLDWEDAAWHGLFHAISSYNNAGFSSWSDSMMGFARDPLMLGPVALAVFIGAIGFPVLADLLRDPGRPVRWSLHTKLTLVGTGILLGVGFAVILAYEWNNAATLGALEPAHRVVNAAFHAIMPRSGGLNSLDVGQMRDETLIVTYGLMLTGGGSAGTGGGVRVTTVVVLALVVWAVARGEPDSSAYGRRIPVEVQRQALAVMMLGITLPMAGTLVLLSLTDFPLRDVIFEVISATATVGLSTGITPHLPPSAQLVLSALMFTGRVGTVTVVTALALQRSMKPYRYPEERPIVG
jgi:trk system potassium uptake protein TrkH